MHVQVHMHMHMSCCVARMPLFRAERVLFTRTLTLYSQTTFVVLMLLAATSAGAKFYNYAMLDAYAEKVGALKDKKSAVKKSKELV